MPRLTAVSGFDVKGPACFLLEIAGKRLLLDLGRGPDAGRLPDLAGIGPVDAVLLSHGHADHVGALHLLAEIGDPPVHCTAPVAALAAGALPGRILPDLPRRGAVEVAGVTVETGTAGHAPGAVWMRIGGAGGLIYTGDLCAEGALWPLDPLLPAAALVVDASYGAADLPLVGQQAALLAEASAGPLLLPAPAGGRGLDMALAARAAGHAVRLCPAHRRVAETMQGFADWLAPAGAAALAALLSEAGTLGPDSPAEGVMIAAAPNADAGVAGALGARFAAEGAAQILFTGHVAEGSPAEAWLAAGRARRLRWNVHPRLATLRTLCAATGAAQALAAFTPAPGRLALAGALPGPAWSATGRIDW